MTGNTMTTDTFIEKYAKGALTKPPKPGYVGFVGTHSGENVHRNEAADTTSPAKEADFQRIADRNWGRVIRLTPDGTGELIAEAWPTLHRQMVEADAEITRLWLSCNRGEWQYPETFPAFKAAFRAWARLNLQGARYVRLLDRGIRRIYSHRVKAWLYIVQSKAAVRGVRLRPRGAVYTVEEARALVNVNPGTDELRTIHKVKTMFQGELFAGR